MKVLFELMKCIKDQLTRAKHASRSAAEASTYYYNRYKQPQQLLPLPDNIIGLPAACGICGWSVGRRSGSYVEKGPFALSYLYIREGCNSHVTGCNSHGLIYFAVTCELHPCHM